MPILQGCSPDTLSRLEQETPVRSIFLSSHAYSHFSLCDQVIQGQTSGMEAFSLWRELHLVSLVLTDLWRDHCKRSFPASVDELLAVQSETNAQWHDLFFVRSLRLLLLVVF